VIYTHPQGEFVLVLVKEQIYARASLCNFSNRAGHKIIISIMLGVLDRTNLLNYDKTYKKALYI